MVNKGISKKYLDDLTKEINALNTLVTTFSQNYQKIIESNKDLNEKINTNKNSLHNILSHRKIS